MFRRIASVIFNFILRVFYPVEVYGRENISKENFLIIANHGHMFDPFLVNYAFKEHFYIIGKAELFKIPILRKILELADVFPVSRDQLDLGAIKTSIAKLAQSSLLLFPEGTRNHSLDPLEGKSGAIMIASKAEVKILPMVLVGNFKIFRPLKVFILPAREVGEYGFERLNSQAYKSIVDSLLNDIYTKLREETNDH